MLWTYRIGVACAFVAASVMPGAAVAQSQEEACAIILSQDYDTWTERLEEYRTVLEQTKGPLTDAEIAHVEEVVETSWQRSLMPSADAHTAEEIKSARRQACGYGIQDVASMRMAEALPPSDDELIVRIGDLLGDYWREQGEIALVNNLLIRFGSSCDDFRSLALSHRAQELDRFSREGHSCPFTY